MIDLYQKESQKTSNSSKVVNYDLYPVLQPSVEHFITVLLAYGRRKDKKRACDRMKELLVEMERLHESGMNVKPNYQVSLYSRISFFFSCYKML